MKETDLIRQIRQHYRLDPVLCLFRTNVTPKTFPRRYFNKARQCWTTSTGYAEPLPKGFSDLMGILRPMGRSIFIETKIGKNEQSIEQIAFQRLVEDQGAIYILARCLEDVTNVIGRLRLQ